MKNRAILARLKAKKKKTSKKAKKEELTNHQILARDPESGEVLHTFESFKDVEAAEFRVTNVKSSIKTGNKYKGLLWDLSE